MHMDMDHGDHAQMTAECKRLGCTKKSIEDRISKVIQGSIFTQGKVQKNKSWFNTDVLLRRKRVTNDHYYTHLFLMDCLNTSFTTARYVNMEKYSSKYDMLNKVATGY